MRLRKSVISCLLLVVCYGAAGQGTGAAEKVVSLQNFVQGFYDWYVPLVLADHTKPAWEFALKEKKSAFAPEISKALREDSEARAQSSGEIVGLDFDPFLNSQDPSDHYQVGKIARKGASYFVDIHAVSSGRRTEASQVVAELLRKGGEWQFVDFHYPEGKDLIGLLKVLREGRRESRDRPPS